MDRLTEAVRTLRVERPTMGAKAMTKHLRAQQYDVDTKRVREALHWLESVPAAPMSTNLTKRTATWSSLLEGLSSVELPSRRCWRSPILSDWELQLGSMSYHVHTAELGEGTRASELLQSQIMRWDNGSRVTNLSMLLPSQTWCCIEEALDFVYHGTLELTTHNAARLFAFAHVLRIPALAMPTVDFLRSEHARTGAAAILCCASELGIESLIEKFIEILIDAFDLNALEDFVSVPFDCAVRILDDTYLRTDEDSVFAAIDAYVKANSATLSESQVESLWQTCRFAYVSPKTLVAAATFTSMPVQWLALGAIGRVAREADDDYARERLEVNCLKIDSTLYEKLLRPRSTLDKHMRYIRDELGLFGDDPAKWTFSGVEIGLMEEDAVMMEGSLVHNIKRLILVCYWFLWHSEIQEMETNILLSSQTRHQMDQVMYSCAKLLHASGKVSHLTQRATRSRNKRCGISRARLSTCS
jgi:hypothetical protein